MIEKIPYPKTPERLLKQAKVAFDILINELESQQIDTSQLRGEEVFVRQEDNRLQLGFSSLYIIQSLQGRSSGSVQFITSTLDEITELLDKLQKAESNTKDLPGI